MWRQLKDFVRAKKNSCDAWVVWSWRCFEKTDCLGCGEKEIWAGVYHNPSLGLISLSSDWKNWITITDKNLWATEVWNPWDALTQQNVWYFYQRWNCHPRPLWNVPASSITYTKADASWYWPWNPRYNDIFIRNAPWDSNYRDSSDNFNIWWWWWDELEYMYDNWNDRKLRQFMCDDWFHIPSWWELINLLQELVKIDNMLNDSWLIMERKDDFIPSSNKRIYSLNKSFDWWKYILAPKAWWINAKNWVYSSWGISLYSSSSMNTVWQWHYNDAVRLMMWWKSYNWIYSAQKCSWCNIRPFKDEPVAPDNSWGIID